MKPDSPQWIAAKAHGDRAELAIAEWFQTLGWRAFKTLGQADFDLLLQCEVEVKHDLQAPRTGRVAIETHYRRQPSGILTSKAAWWCIVTGERAFIVKRESLLRFVMAGAYREIAAGDMQRATVRLVPLKDLETCPTLLKIELGARAGAQP